MNVNDGTPAPTEAEESTPQHPLETVTAPADVPEADSAPADPTPVDPTPADPAVVETETESGTAEAGADDATAAAQAGSFSSDGTSSDGAASEDGSAPSADAAPSADPAAAADTDDDSGETTEERMRRLEEEGDIAADYLEELLDIADLDGDIDIDVDGDRASVEVAGADKLARLNRPKGELLDALQELARLAVQTRTGRRSRLMLDIGGFRAEHKNSLEELAATAIAEAKDSGSPVPMRPMNPFERKVVHDVAKDEGLRSESDGDGKNRHVVIYPAS